MNEREQQIAKIIALVLFDSREVPPPKCVEAARRIAALPQPITAETVRPQCHCFSDYDRNFCTDKNICRPMAEAQRTNVEVKCLL